MIMENQGNRSNTDDLNKTPQKNSSTRQEERENKDIDYSDLDIEESTGGSAMEDEKDASIRDMDDEEI